MEYDVVVVGGGLAGSIPAAILASRGYRVLLVDEYIVGGRASSLSLGLVAPSGGVEAEAATKLLSSLRGCGDWMYRRIPVYHVQGGGGGGGGAIEELGIRVRGGYRVTRSRGFIVDVDAYIQCIVARAVDTYGLKLAEGARAVSVSGDGVVVLEAGEKFKASAIVVAVGSRLNELLANTSIAIASAILAGFEKKKPVETMAGIVDAGTGLRVVVEGASLRAAWLEPGGGSLWASTSPAETTPKPPPAGIELDTGRPLAHYRVPVTAPPEPVVESRGSVVYVALPGLRGVTLSYMVGERVADTVERLLSGRVA